jgi:glycosyltransferase involved in cell wall biosynthesis
MKKNNNFINIKKKQPLFSIITVVLNNDKYLEKTIKSVINQKSKNFEYIIIDGGSKDSSLEIIKKYKNKINYFVSEKDNGIYDAFNKGMKIARGKFICIVNSDDILKNNALSIIKNYIDQNPKIDFIFGSVIKHWGVLHGYRPEKIKYSWGFYSSHSTGFYVKRESAKKIGLYNLKYKYHADYDYFYRMIVKKKMKGIATKKNEIVGIFRRGGFSSKISYRKSFFEELKIRYDNNQNILSILIIATYKFFKHFKKIIK